MFVVVLNTRFPTCQFRNVEVEKYHEYGCELNNSDHMAEAQEQFVQALEILDDEDGGANDEAMRVRVVLSRSLSYMRAKELKNAERMLNEAIDGAKQLPDSNGKVHPLVEQCEQHMVRFLMGQQNRVTEAEPYLRRCIDAQQARQAPMTDWLATNRQLATVLFNKGNFPEAYQKHQLILQNTLRIYPPESKPLIGAFRECAEMAWAVGHFSDAKDKMFQAWKLARQHKIPAAQIENLKSRYDRIKRGDKYAEGDVSSDKGNTEKNRKVADESADKRRKVIEAQVRAAREKQARGEDSKLTEDEKAQIEAEVMGSSGDRKARAKRPGSAKKSKGLAKGFL